MYFSFSYIGFKLLTKVYYRVAQLQEVTTYSLFRSINIQIKGFRKLGQG